MSTKPVIFWGATAQARVLRECIKGSGMELLALFDHNPAAVSPFPDVPIFHGDEGFTTWLAARGEAAEGVGFLVAVGGFHGRRRVELQESLSAQGLEPLVAQHRTAFVAPNASIGPGSQILAQSAVCVEASLGRGCIINTGATVDHQCRLGDGVHICPGAHLAGEVCVREFATIGTGACVLPGVRIGREAIVAAGAVVTRDVPDGGKVMGVPARPAD